MRDRGGGYGRRKKTGLKRIKQRISRSGKGIHAVTKKKGYATRAAGKGVGAEGPSRKTKKVQSSKHLHLHQGINATGKTTEKGMDWEPSGAAAFQSKGRGSKF